MKYQLYLDEKFSWTDTICKKRRRWSYQSQVAEEFQYEIEVLYLSPLGKFFNSHNAPGATPLGVG